MPRLTQRDFERLLEFRVTLRRFQRWSEDQAQAAGLTQVQHQLLVAIKGYPGDESPTVGELAGYLLLRPHSTVELVDRAEAAGLAERTPDADDGCLVRVRLTREGDRILRQRVRHQLTAPAVHGGHGAGPVRPRAARPNSGTGQAGAAWRGAWRARCPGHADPAAGARAAAGLDHGVC